MRVQHAVLLFFCIALSATRQGSAQSCADLIRQAGSQRVGTVSVGELRISEKARQHLRRARIASEQDQPLIFEREAAAALAAAPRYGEVYLLKAVRELHDGRPEAALQMIVTARQMQPQLPWSAVIMAGALNKLYRFSEVLAELDRAPRDEADSWQAHYERARANTGLSHIEAALHWSDLAVAAAPVGCTDVRIIRANVFGIAGRQPEAIAELETYLALDRRGTHREQVLDAIARARESLGQGDGFLALR